MKSIRVWDKKLKEMISGEDLVKMCIMVSPANGNLINYKEPYIYLKDRYEIMESIGVKDNNLNEIFKGDILKCVYCKNVGRGVKWIEWIYIIELEKNHCFGYRFVRKNIKRDEIENFTKEEYEKFREDVIIGNIYENPELLISEKEQERKE